MITKNGRVLTLFLFCIATIQGCGRSTVDIEKETIQSFWWESATPDIVVDNHEFYTRNCSITQVTINAGVKEDKVIFEVPFGFLTTCDQQGPLQYDGQYIILEVCEMTFGAGGCGGGRYRSADLENWEEYIGVTWIDSEEYEAWRKLGSKSSKADSVKKVVK